MYSESKRKYDKEYQQKNKKKIKERDKKYRRQNRDKINKQKRNYRKTIKGRYVHAKILARVRKLSWDISFEDYSQLIKNVCYYHHSHNLSQTGIGLDRINNSLGYSIDNVLPCCPTCNINRGNRYTVEEWKIMITALENFRNR